MTGYTSRGYPFPDDYQAAADAPAAYQALAESVDADVAGVDADVQTRSPNTHTHDDRYYTESEADALLAGKSGTGHVHDERYYTEAEVNSLLAGREPVDSSLLRVAGSVGAVSDKRIYAVVWDVGTLGPDSEVTSGLYTVPAGCYVVASVQHFSNYLNVVVNFVSTTQFDLQVRNSTTGTTHSNIKVHAIIINL